MAMVDYTTIGVGDRLTAYYFDKRVGNKIPLVCNTNNAIDWVENVMHIEPQRDIHSNYTYYVTDEQLSMFILKFS